MPVEFAANRPFKGPNSVCKRYYLARTAKHAGDIRFVPHHRREDGTLEAIGADMTEDEAIAACEAHAVNQ
jgi:hypothetical protein